MDHAAYHVVYVDNRANNDLDGTYIQKPRPEYSDGSELGSNDTWEFRGSEYVELIMSQIEEVRDNIKCILSNFNGGMFDPPPWNGIPKPFPGPKLEVFCHILLTYCSAYMYVRHYLHGEIGSS